MYIRNQKVQAVLLILIGSHGFHKIDVLISDWVIYFILRRSVSCLSSSIHILLVQRVQVGSGPGAISAQIQSQHQ